MEQTYNIQLEEYKTLKSSNVNESLTINLTGNNLLLPSDYVGATIDLYDEYISERKSSNKFRLTISISPYCSNVLFNPFTEIIKNEGSSNVKCLNFITEKNINGAIGKKKDFEWNAYQAIRDTQLSNNACGYEYHCGLDIFNNHLLRSKTFKTVTYNSKYANSSATSYQTYYSLFGITHKFSDSPIYNIEENNFNTIDDNLRDKNGIVVSQVFPSIMDKNLNSPVTFFGTRYLSKALHLYQKHDVYTFKQAYAKRLIDDNGWYGFKNRSTIPVIGDVNSDSGNNTSTEEINFSVYPDKAEALKNKQETYSSSTITAKKTIIKDDTADTKTESILEINKVINNKGYNEFIDMYPGRDLFAFTPKYNNYKNRLEYNWKTILTYPSESIKYLGYSDGKPINFAYFFDVNGKNNLRIFMVDEGVYDDNGSPLVTIYSVCKHGLREGDYINLYKKDELIYDSAEVLHVIDPYIFQIYKESRNISDKWEEIEPGQTTKLPYTEALRVNLDDDFNKLSFCRVVNDVECEYYIRKFSKLPNFKFADREINDYTLYGDNSILKKYTGDVNKADDNKYIEHENHVGKAGFSETAYGDDVTNIIYTDDIDISYLRDNLGRPVSEIFLTIVKNNKGYEEWYNSSNWKSGTNSKSENIEFSHCFGKVNGAFLMSDYVNNYTKNTASNEFFRREKDNVVEVNEKYIKDARFITSTDESLYGTDGDVNDAKWFYGDICCYSPTECSEQVLEISMHRFNTYQREMGKIPFTNDKGLYYDELLYDEQNGKVISNNNGITRSYSDNSIQRSQHSELHTMGNMNKFREGYYHQAHYRIPLKTVSQSLSSEDAIKFSIYDIFADKEDNTPLISFKTDTDNNLSEGEKLIFHKRSTNEYWIAKIYEIVDYKWLRCIVKDSNDNIISEEDDIYKIFKGNEYRKELDDYVLLAKPYDVPSYATLIKDGSCRFYWREVISNGIENDDVTYPFTNGVFYVNRNINFYLRRQDPYKTYLGIPTNITTGDKIESPIDYTPDSDYITDYYDNIDSDEYYSANDIDSTPC